MGNHREAIKDFDTAIKKDKNYELSYFHRGVSYLKSREFRKAESDFILSNTKMSNPRSLDGLGQCYHMMNRFDDAIEKFDDAIEIDPRNTEFLKNRA